MSSTTTAVSEITQEVDRAFMWIGGVSLVLFVGITVALVVLALRYRRSRAAATVQIEGNKVLEIVWIVIPTIIVTWMFFVGYRGFEMMRDVPEDAMRVEVTGRQWSWAFRYPEEGVATTEMVVPVATPVKAALTAPADDVLHSFYIPDFRVKEDVVPGRETYLWFEARREGVYNIFCAEFCGKDHAKMLSLLRVVSREEYDAWIHQQRMKKYKPLELAGVMNPEHRAFGPDELNIDAAALYGTFCASCHGAEGDGAGLPDEARNFKVASGWKRGPKVSDVYRTLMEGVPGTRMRAYPNFTPWERVALAHEVRRFIGDEAPADSPEDYAALVETYGLDKVQQPRETIPVDQAIELLVAEAQDGGGET